MFKLEIETCNASFRDDYDNIDPTGLEIREIVPRVMVALANGVTSGVILDNCGNTVGSWSYTDD